MPRKPKIKVPSILSKNQFGKEEYLRLYENLKTNLEPKEEFTFLTYCVEYGNYIQFEIDLQTEGSVIKAGNGTLIPNPKNALKQSSFNSMMKAAMQIGITPKSRIKNKGAAKLSKIDMLKGIAKRG